MVNVAVGINDINVYGSTLAVDFANIAVVRGISDKDFNNMRFVRRSVVPAFEDPVTLAVNAAKPIVDAASPDEFELLIVATETGVDYAKPLSSYVHKHLNLSPYCRNFEIKHACYAGTAALQMATSWLRSGVAPGKKALIITTDIGRPHFNELAELSTGAGAVAFSITVEPRVFILETQSGYASQEIFDTARPTPLFERIDRVLSLGAYLDLLEMAWEKYRCDADVVSFEEHFAYMVYHTPLVSLLEQAHRLLLESDGRDVSKDELAASLDRMVIPALRYNQELGNIYSGSLYTALTGLLELASVEPGMRVGCFSYGSGACAEVFSGLVAETAHEIIAARHLGKQLAARRLVSVAEYETTLRMVEQSLMRAEFEPEWSISPGHYEQAYQGKNLLVLEGVSDYYRTYKWS